MKKIAVGDLGDFWYGDYKEPFVQLEGAVPGYPQGVVLKDDDGKLLCAYCGKTYDNLGAHAPVHGMTASQYKREVGLLQKSALVSETQRLRLTRQSLRLKAQGHVPPFRKGRSNNVATRKIAYLNGEHVPERLNKTGRCYAQVLAVARSLASKGRLSQKTIRAHGIGQKTVERYFGSHEDLLKLVGQPRHSSTRLLLPRAQLVDMLRNLAADLGRTPTGSDLRRYGLPTRQTFHKRFGSYSEACRAAGLDPWMPTPRDIPADFEERALVAYATLGSLGRAARAISADETRVAAVLDRYGIAFRLPPNDRRRREMREFAAEVARRIAGWPDVAAVA